MRCNCCDKELSDSEATAKFVEKDGSKPHRYVEMCHECRGFLPPDIKIVSRPVREVFEEPEERDEYHLDDGDGDVWDDC